MRLVIRKVQFAPALTGSAPKTQINRQFMMSDKPLHLEASMDKEVSVAAVSSQPDPGVVLVASVLAPVCFSPWSSDWSPQAEVGLWELWLLAR